MTDTSANAKGKAAIAGLWSLLWHSVVLLPVMVAMFGVWCHAWMGLLALPVAAGICLWDGDWRLALACIALWPVCLVCLWCFWRREHSERCRYGWL